MYDEIERTGYKSNRSCYKGLEPLVRAQSGGILDGCEDYQETSEYKVETMRRHRGNNYYREKLFEKVD